MEIPGYLIQREIGKGGMATVYLAIQESLHRPVVLKILDNVDAAESRDLTERFMAEGRIIASLTHPNIITIYDIGQADSLHFIASEFIEGLPGLFKSQSLIANRQSTIANRQFIQNPNTCTSASPVCASGRQRVFAWSFTYRPRTSGTGMVLL